MGTNILKTIANCCFVFLAVFAAIVSLAYGYYHFFVHDFTVGVNYVDDQTGLDVLEKIQAGDLNEEQIAEYESRKFIEVNYYSNDKGNGFELQEMKLNYFMDPTLNSVAYRSTGMQYLGNYTGSLWSGKYTTYEGKSIVEKSGDIYYGRDSGTVNSVNNYVNTDFYYYDSTNGIQFDGITNNNGAVATQLKRDTSLIVSIGNKPFLIKLNKYTDQKVGEARKYFVVNWKSGDIYNRFYYTYCSLFEACMKAVRTNSAKYGDWYVTLNVSDMFTVYEYDEVSKKFKDDDITDEIFTYVVMKFHYNENGARNSTQSMFGIIEDNPSYDVEQDDIDTSYWQERMVYTLTDKNFDLRYSDVYGGYFVSLNIDTKALFEEMPRVKANVKIDTLFGDKKIVGIDYNGFENFEIDTLTINGTGTFYVLNKALYNTKIQTIKHGSGLTLDIVDGAVNNVYTEVIA